MKTTSFLIATVAVSFCLAIDVQAQHVRAEPDQPAVWGMFIGQQLAESLDSPVVGIRTKALEHITLLARSFGDKLDLTEATPALLSIYTSDPDERCRLAAVVGLHAIADEGGFQKMRQGIASQESKRVQHAALAVLMDYYGAETFEGSDDMAAVAESVLRYYSDVGLTPPVIALAD